MLKTTRFYVRTKKQNSDVSAGMYDTHLIELRGKTVGYVTSYTPHEIRIFVRYFDVKNRIEKIRRITFAKDLYLNNMQEVEDYLSIHSMEILKKYIPVVIDDKKINSI